MCVLLARGLGLVWYHTYELGACLISGQAGKALCCSHHAKMLMIVKESLRGGGGVHGEYSGGGASGNGKSRESLWGCPCPS
jgi:hypothetical protein